MDLAEHHGASTERLGELVRAQHPGYHTHAPGTELMLYYGIVLGIGLLALLVYYVRTETDKRRYYRRRRLEKQLKRDSGKNDAASVKHNPKRGQDRTYPAVMHRPQASTEITVDIRTASPYAR